MRNVWLVMRREYIEHVRTKSFIISTLLLPAFMAAVIMLPAKFATMQRKDAHKMVLVASNEDFARSLEAQLVKREKPPDDPSQVSRQVPFTSRYKIEVSLDNSEEGRKRLRERVASKEIDSFLIATDEALDSGMVEYRAREVSDFLELGMLRGAITLAAMERRLTQRGLPPAELDNLLKEVRLDTARVTAEGEKKAGGRGMFFGTFMMAMMMYMMVLLHGVAVMRSVLEEKSSRVMEVLLSSLTSKELMAGKILGVGSVGLTQVGIWAVLATTLSAPAIAAMREQFSGMQINVIALVFFGVFFLLGYLLYASLFAALGAMVNTEQEAQNLQFFVMLPLIASTILMFPVLQQPNSVVSVTASFFPFTTPILMYIRVLVQQPPLWQLLLSVGILLATIYGVLVVCSRIYRVGILMYGKRPGLRELVRWLRY